MSKPLCSPRDRNATPPRLVFEENRVPCGSKRLNVRIDVEKIENLHVGLVRLALVRVVVESASLVCPPTVSVNEHVPTLRLLVFCDCPVSKATRSDRGPRCNIPRPLGLGEPTCRRRSLFWYRVLVAIVCYDALQDLPPPGSGATTSARQPLAFSL